DLAAKIFPSAEDRQFAQGFLRDLPQPLIAIHPGSGSEQKTWPAENWLDVGSNPSLVIAGEADDAQVARLKTAWKDQEVRFARNLPLPQLGAVLANAIFIAHDSGISHLAAADGANRSLLVGSTDPAVWAPKNEN